MSKFVVYVQVEPYLKQWLTHSFGDPVEFPSCSNENAVLRLGSSRSAQSITNLSNLEREMLQLAYLTPSLKAQKHTTSLTVMPSRHSPKASTISSA